MGSPSSSADPSMGPALPIGPTTWPAARITSYFVPSNSGYYRFYLRSDDTSQLYMNINSTDSQNPAGRILLIHQPNANITVQDPRAISPPVLLNAGQAYYTEALMKEGTGGDYLMLTFRQTDANGTAVSVPTDTVAEIASASAFGGAPGNPDAITILSTPPSDVYTNEDEFVSLSLNAVVPLNMFRAVCYQWQKFDGVSMGYTNIPGATQPTLNFYVPLADNGVAYRLVFLAPGGNRTYVTTLHVTTDVTPPYIAAASSLNGTNIDLCFNEPLEFNSADDDFNYTVNGGLNLILEARVRPDGRSVTLTIDPPLGGPGTVFTVQADNIVDLAATPLSGSSVTNGIVQGLAPLDIGTAGVIGVGGYNAAAPDSSFSCAPGSVDVSANAWDIWNGADGYHFTSRQVTGNFDVKVRVQRLVGADQWSKAGLMARGTLASNSRFIMMLATPETTPITGQAANNFFSFQYRDADGASAAPALNNVNSPPPVGYPNGWVRLQRLGSVFNGYSSSNGVDWVLLSSRDSAANTGGAYPDTCYVGLATVSHDQTRSLANNALAEYRNLSFPPAPVITQQPGPFLVV